ncbi:flagellar biosynthesis protein FlhB [Pallidibacillus pasinlerensis]|uniref:Flagellar biosynthetic protein FlhB n=1 Tax=Pallidibacillus pasinlerensis TaxID=2703818 RepID=A0ABW9ZZB3_9BACI|nr:flagellar biosynthesis protein FlhB [Pallidibacillus pasinlerensis]NCU16516.1 flagellar biosynthesis protein FlhB [Pallidibacillus pasinlerensis]
MIKYRLDLQFFAGEKTEKATPKKRQDVRKKGQTAKSQDINTAVILLFVFAVLIFLGPSIIQNFLNIFLMTFEKYFLMDLTENSLETIAIETFLQLLKIIAPIFLVAIIAALIANYIQVGVLFTGEPLKMKLEKLDPIKGFKRIFSLRAIVELVKSILKVSIIGVIGFIFLQNNLPEILNLITSTPANSLAAVASVAGKMGLYMGGALLFIAILDYMYQKYDFEKNIRMSKQDIKDEHKNIEGDPLIKSRIKQRQREIATRRMMEEVPKADVVITNPTHYAVALKYDESKADAPIVVAKGVDFIAQKIKLIAKENDVVTVENRPLARSLYAETEIGQEIPEQFFKAVAEILAYVYRVQKKI